MARKSAPKKAAKKPVRRAKLTAKQQRFVEEYLVDLNATQAAVRAGYSDRTAYSVGPENLKKPGIVAALTDARAKRSERTEITADRVLEEYAKIAFSDMRAFAKWGPDGVTLIKSDKLPEGAALCVAEVSETKTQFGGSIKFKLHDKKGALDSVARHLGMFTERVELTGKNGGPLEVRANLKIDWASMSPAELKAARGGLVAIQGALAKDDVSAA